MLVRDGIGRRLCGKAAYVLINVLQQFFADMEALATGSSVVLKREIADDDDDDPVKKDGYFMCENRTGYVSRDCQASTPHIAMNAEAILSL